MLFEYKSLTIRGDLEVIKITRKSDGVILWMGLKTLQYSSNNESYGKVSGTDIGNYRYGTSVTIIATPESRYAFDGWYNGDILVSSSSTYTFNLYDNINLIAHFSEIQWISSTNESPYDSHGGWDGGRWCPSGYPAVSIPDRGYGVIFKNTNIYKLKTVVCHRGITYIYMLSDDKSSWVSFKYSGTESSGWEVTTTKSSPILVVFYSESFSYIGNGKVVSITGT